MTETNKQRVVKYWNILFTMDIRTFSSIAENRYTSAIYSRGFITAVNCAIAEVEAIIEALEEYDLVTEAEFIHYGKELIELKQML